VHVSRHNFPSLLWLCCLPLAPDFEALMDQMDVDTTTPPSSSSKRSPTSCPTSSSSAEKRAKLILPEPQLISLNHRMKRRSDVWQVFVNKAEYDESRWRDLLSDVLMCLTKELASTDMKGSVIVSPNLDGADEFVNRFEKEVFEEWKVGVREGVENNDWTRLIAHRTTRFPLISI